jgi:hypothetical protein
LSRATHRWSLQANGRRATVERVTIQRIEHVGIVVDDLAAATAFFVELGLELQGEGSVDAVGSTAWWGSRTSAWSTR